MAIHHVTAIAREPQRNLDFYAGTLGMRLVKLTVNYDDPGTYHLYYGDDLGRPGSLLTFFPWTGGRPGLKLPPQHEPTRRRLERSLPPLCLPYAEAGENPTLHPERAQRLRDLARRWLGTGPGKVPRFARDEDTPCTWLQIEG